MRIIFFISLFITFNAAAQVNSIYEKLPVGKYEVGFSIFTLTDDARVEKPEYNYLGEKNKGDRHKKITVHLWYPALAKNDSKRIKYRDYCYNHLLTKTNEVIPGSEIDGQINDRRASVERWFGKTTDDAWKKLLTTSMLAVPGATPVKGNFPLLIGVLRSLSTSIVNEMLASNGYIVAMITAGNASSFAESALTTVPDMQFVISSLGKTAGINTNNVGTFGFSGSGFTQVYLAMHDYRIKALVDIESGIYMDQLYQDFSKSDYYTPTKLKVPFLHIFSRDLSKQEKFIGDFENKSRFSSRYRLILNQPALHHWDFASEGYTSAILLNNRGEQQKNIRQSFEIASLYLLNFFNAELKHDATAKIFLSSKPSLQNTESSLWDIAVLNASIAAPDKDDFEYILKTKGIDEAIAITTKTIKQDSLSNIWQWYNLNGLGYNFLRQKKFKEAIEIFKLNTDLHPDDPNLFDSLAEGYESSGDKENMKKTSGKVIDLLAKKDSLSDAEKGLKGNAEKRLK